MEIRSTPSLPIDDVAPNGYSNFDHARADFLLASTFAELPAGDVRAQAQMALDESIEGVNLLRSVPAGHLLRGLDTALQMAAQGDEALQQVLSGAPQDASNLLLVAARAYADAAKHVPSP